MAALEIVLALSAYCCAADDAAGNARANADLAAGDTADGMAADEAAAGDTVDGLNVEKR